MQPATSRATRPQEDALEPRTPSRQQTSSRSSASTTVSTICTSQRIPKEKDENERTQQTILRERERRSRVKRKATVVRMREQLKALEYAATTLPLISDADAIWDAFLDDDAKQMRAYLRNCVRVTQESKKLTQERLLLRRLVEDHRLFHAAMSKWMQEAVHSGDDWKWNVSRWSAITAAYFIPWTVGECTVEVDAAIKEMNQFIWSTDTTTTGMSILGWHDSSRFDKHKASIQFSFSKSFSKCNLRHHVSHIWEIYTNVDTYTRVLLGGKARASVEIVQQVTHDMWIVRYDERYNGQHLNVHVLYLLFRQETETGFLQYLRSIHSRDVQRATDEETDCWTSDSVWLRWDLLDEKDEADLTATDYTLSVGGSLAGEDLSYASRWLFEALAALIRAEHAATGKQLLQF